jgi:hypothetical protein
LEGQSTADLATSGRLTAGNKFIDNPQTMADAGKGNQSKASANIALL